ncbi:MAG: hypothetical protein K2Q07_07015 [Burkholderiaceae bacterium]|nr:hypothetical protein [Burkholderiaceae bacterium]
MAHRNSPDAPLTLVGNSLAVLVAATERARRGLRTVVVNPGGPWGGYFGGVQADGRRWDAGMVMYEFTSFRQPVTPPALSSYDPLQRNDIGRFCEVVRAHVHGRQATCIIKPPQMWIGKRLLPDLLLANGLSALPELNCAPAALDELRHQVEAARLSPWHASRKGAWLADGRRAPGDNALLDCDSVSRLNHGTVLHNAVFAPFAHQVLGRDASHLAALYHRIPWLPLYWPETLLSWLQGQPQPLPVTEFSYPHHGSVADLCAQMAAEMQASPSVTVHHNRVLTVGRLPQGFALQLEQGSCIHTARLGWGQTPCEGLQASGIAADPPPGQRLPLLLAFIRLPRKALRREFSVLHIADSASGAYRINNVSHCAGENDSDSVRLVLEANPVRFAEHHGAPSDDAAIGQSVINDLAGLGLIDDGQTPEFVRLLKMAGALPLPSADGLAAQSEQRALLAARWPDVELFANSAGPFATSLSDQIVQGLLLARTEEGEPPSNDIATRIHACTH